MRVIDIQVAQQTLAVLLQLAFDLDRRFARSVALDQVQLVPEDEQLGRLAGDVGDQVADPVGDHVFEGGGAIQVEDYNDAVRVAVVGGYEGAVLLLPGGVPNLELDFLARDLQVFEGKVDAQGRKVLIGKSVVDDSPEEGSLAHGRIPDDYYFENHIKPRLRFQVIYSLSN